MLYTVRIEAFVQDGQIAKALLFLEQHRGEFEDEVYRRLSLNIEVQKGFDPRIDLEKLYESTNSLLTFKIL